METHIEDELNEFLNMTEKDRTADYLFVLKDTNFLIKKLMNRVEELEKNLREQRELRDAAEQKLSDLREIAGANVTRYLFNSYVKVSNARDCTPSEWMHFLEQFKFSEENKLLTEIYAWIDTHIPN